MKKPRRCKAGKGCMLSRGKLLAYDWFKPHARYCKLCSAIRRGT